MLHILIILQHNIELLHSNDIFLLSQTPLGDTASPGFASPFEKKILKF
jgi:hypothetical protein